MIRRLEHFQDAFIEALQVRAAPELSALTAQLGFQVYRNTVLKGCVEALCDNFPSVERLVGRDWLRAAAVVHANACAPSDARLIFYGADFPAFLAAFEPARELPYLGPVAQLDYLWIEAFCAVQEPALELASLAGVSPEALATCHLRPRASARWRWFDEQPIYSLWRCNREGVDLPDNLPWQGEGALLVGHCDGVTWHALEPAGCVFLDACAAGHDLERASALALQRQGDLDFTDLLSRLLGARVFSPLVLA